MAPLMKCMNCGKDSKFWCADCVAAPEYQPGDATVSIYCNHDCQKEQWSSHRVYCRSLSQRKRLLRAALILRAALLTYREVTYDIDLTKIELKDGVLHLYQNQRLDTVQSKRGPFPDHLTSNIEYKEAALVNNQCTTAMALLSRMTWKLLEGITSTIEVLDLQIGKPLIPTKLVPGPDPSVVRHNILKVRLTSADEDWVIDTAGCQYGFRDVLVPFAKYIAEYSSGNDSLPTTYQWTETKDLDCFGTLPTRAQREDLKLEREARLHFAKFVDTNVIKDMLTGSAAEFQEKFDGFVSELKLHMLSIAK